MHTLLEDHPFLERVFEQLTIRALVRHPILLYFRVIKMTVLSILDLWSDVYVITQYFEKEETMGYGRSLAAMVASSMALQALVSFGQHRKKPSRIPLELVFVVAGIKPGYDAYNLCVGKEIGEHETIDSSFVYSKCGNSATHDSPVLFCLTRPPALTKAIEVLCESIPGCILREYPVHKRPPFVRTAVPLFTHVCGERASSSLKAPLPCTHYFIS